MARPLYNNTPATSGAGANKNNRRNRNRNKRNNKNQKKPATTDSKADSTNDSNVTDEVLDVPPENASQENTATSNSSAAASPTKILSAGTTIDSISDDVQGVKLSGDDENDDDQSSSSPELQNGLVDWTFLVEKSVLFVGKFNMKRLLTD